MGVRLEEMADLPFSWRSVKSSDSGIVFMIKPNFNLNTCSYQLDVFDGSKLWREVMHKDKFFERCKVKLCLSTRNGMVGGFLTD